MQEFDFSGLSIIEIPVISPENENYILREADGGAAVRFTDERARCVQFEDGGMSGVEGPGKLPILLLSLCLFETDDHGDILLNKPVNPNIIKCWPDRVIQQLFDKAKEISEIEQDDLPALRKQYKELGEKLAKMEEDEAKNEQTDMEIGSS